MDLREWALARAEHDIERGETGRYLHLEQADGTVTTFRLAPEKNLGLLVVVASMVAPTGERTALTVHTDAHTIVSAVDKTGGFIVAVTDGHWMSVIPGEVEYLQSLAIRGPLNIDEWAQTVGATSAQAVEL
jgi:hypothetical protein